MRTILDTILEDVREEVSAAKLLRTAADIRAMVADAAPPRDFHAALASSFGLIAEIKERSPSVGPMREENVREAAGAYAESPIVRAVSVLTNQHHFGMDIGRLQAVRATVPQPVLRKDFLLDEYQVREARAFGADAILLMANVLDAAQMRGFYDLARELGMEAIFEVHTADEMGSIPAGARIAGINSRKFQSESGFVGGSGASEKDFSIDLGVFGLAGNLPSGCLRVAESGITPSTLGRVREEFQAALVGTSLLRDPRGLRACLREFEAAALLRNG
ncbi:MAG: indole-3-glycerol phosphate synthase TrpC [Verrucomicrobiae bacterium]